MFETMATGSVEVLLDAAARGVVLLAVAGVLTLALRRSSAALRHLVWTAALGGLLAMPVLTTTLPRVEVAVPEWLAPWGSASAATPVPTPRPVPASAPTSSLPAPTAAAPSRATEMESARSGDGAGGELRSAVVAGLEGGVFRSGVDGYGDDAVAASDDPVAAGRDPAAAGHVPAAHVAAGEGVAGGAAKLLVALWLLGMAGLLAPVGAGWLAVRRLERRSAAVRDPRLKHLATRLALRLGLRREFRLLRGPAGTMPMTWGIRRPVVVLPAEAVAWPAARLEAVLLHELAHVARRDCLTQLVAELARAAHWFNPLVWLAARRLRVERELACDDVALAGGIRASDYAGELLGLARKYRASRSTTMAAVAMARPSQLSGRLLAVLDERRSRSPVGRGAALRAAAGTAVLALPVAVMAPAPARAADDGAALAAGAAVAIPTYPTPFELLQRPRPHADADRSAGGHGLAVERPGSWNAAATAGAAHQSAATAGAGSDGSVQEPTCAAARADWRTLQHQGTSDDHSGDVRATIRMSRPGCDIEVRLDGRVEFDTDALSIARLGPGARVRLEEDDGRTERYLEIRPGPGGAPAYDFRLNGREAPFDAQAQAWYRAVVVQLFRTAGFAAGERVESILRRDGVEGVLRELGEIESSYVFSRYAQALMERAELDAAALRSLVRTSAARVDSDHYMAEILESVAEHQPLRGGMLDDFIVAAMTVDSDHYRTEVLRTAVRAGLSGEQVSAVLRAASDMGSDHYKTVLLTEVADRYALEPAFRQTYLRATAEMASDHYRTEVLKRLLARTDLSGPELAGVVAAAGMVGSDHYRTEILKRVAARGLEDPSLQRAFFDAAAGLGSDHYYREAMYLLLDRERVAPALLVTVLDHAAEELDSDHYMSELLLRVLRRHAVDGPVRDAFLRAMDSMASGHYRGRVADALLRADRGGA